MTQTTWIDLFFPGKNLCISRGRKEGRSDLHIIFLAEPSREKIPKKIPKKTQRKKRPDNAPCGISTLTCFANNAARLLSKLAIVGWSGPRVLSLISVASAYRESASAYRYFPCKRDQHPSVSAAILQKHARANYRNKTISPFLRSQLPPTL